MLYGWSCVLRLWYSWFKILERILNWWMIIMTNVKLWTNLMRNLVKSLCTAVPYRQITNIHKQFTSTKLFHYVTVYINHWSICVRSVLNTSPKISVLPEQIPKTSSYVLRCVRQSGSIIMLVTQSSPVCCLFNDRKPIKTPVRVWGKNAPSMYCYPGLLISPDCSIRIQRKQLNGIIRYFQSTLFTFYI